MTAGQIPFGVSSSSLSYILDLDDTIAHTTRDMQDDPTRAANLTLVSGAAQFLAQYGKRSRLVSLGGPTLQSFKLDHLKITGMFGRGFSVVPDSAAKIATIKAWADLDGGPRNTIVMGDRLDIDIRAGNEAGCTTVRMRLPDGKYSRLEPVYREEEPDYTVEDFFEFMSLPFFGSALAESSVRRS